jgi:hypothetical protein
MKPSVSLQKKTKKKNKKKSAARRPWNDPWIKTKAKILNDDQHYTTCAPWDPWFFQRKRCAKGVMCRSGLCSSLHTIFGRQCNIGGAKGNHTYLPSPSIPTPWYRGSRGGPGVRGAEIETRLLDMGGGGREKKKKKKKGKKKKRKKKKGKKKKKNGRFLIFYPSN